MDLFYKGIAAALLTSVLVCQLNRQERDFALLLSLAGTAMIMMAGVRFLQPVLKLLYQLQELGQTQQESLKILLKAAGVGITGEIAATICSESGSSSLGKTIEFLSTAAIAFISVPVFTAMIQVLQQILEES